MDALKAKRKGFRIAFTTCVNKIDELLLKKIPDLKELLILKNQLRDKFERLTACQEEISNGILQIENSDKLFSEDFEAAEEYRDKFHAVSAVLESMLLNSSLPKEVEKRKFKLPEIELKKFSGDPKEFLTFWSQFEKIHLDKSIPDEDKFQYLLQSVIPKSKAARVVESFPATAANYSKAISQLKERFGREDLLVQIYVRELLTMVMRNAISGRAKVELPILYDELEGKLRALDSLGRTQEKYGDFLTPLVESCLPEDILVAWERSRNKGTDSALSDDRTLENLMGFLKQEVMGEEMVVLARTGFGANHHKKSKEGFNERAYEISSAAALVSTNTPENPGKRNLSCLFCDKKHSSQDCYMARKLNIEDKKKILSIKGACFSCLRLGHTSRTCKFRMKCMQCNRNHFILMCPDRETSTNENKTEINTTKVLTDSCTVEPVLLMTLIVKIKSLNNELKIRALVDTGSQLSYLNNRVINRLKLKPKGKQSLVHSLFGGRKSEPCVHEVYEIKIVDLQNTFSVNFDVLSEDKICGLVPKARTVLTLKELKENNLMIPDFNHPDDEIDLLLGANVAGLIMTGNSIKLSSGLVVLETKLGYTLMGKEYMSDKCEVISETDTIESNCGISSIITLHSMNIDANYLWDLDIIGITDPWENSKKKLIFSDTVKQFQDNLTILPNGRYELLLPFKCDTLLSNNKEIAVKRHRNMCKRAAKGNYLKDYIEVFKEWERLKIIEKVPDEEIDLGRHYLPHRPVIKEASHTSKIRPVFDASAKDGNGPSLNDCLIKGPNLIELIPDIIDRFRLYKIGLSADVEKAFLQLSISPEHRDFLRFFFPSEAENFSVYRHCRVVFGVTSSPFLLMASLYHLFENASEEYYDIVPKLKNSFYVDNCVTGVSSLEELAHFVPQTKKLMKNACFNLRGWEGNITSSYLSNSTGDTSLLGMVWDLDQDTLRCNLPTKIDPDQDQTKRTVLSIVQRIFDPLGLLSPATLLPKLLLQDAWKSRIPWDSILPFNLQREFSNWLKETTVFNEIRIPRHLYANETSELHIFVDACKKSYGACVYMRSILDSYEVKVQIVRAKSRVAPMKEMSIPKLELMACCIGARLAHSIRLAFDLPNMNLTFWSDSMTALWWIREHGEWSVFVSNRIKEIRKLTSPEDWRHVPGDQNPADLVSRGCTPQQLVKSQWWNGPQWLCTSAENWPCNKIFCEKEVDLERRKVNLSNLNIEAETIPWYAVKFSRFESIVRLTAWVLRFVSNVRKKFSERKFGRLSLQEKEDAEKFLIKCVQSSFFPKACNPMCNVFKDEDGVIRVKTRITERIDKPSFVSPILLPNKCIFTKRLIEHYHELNCHAGTQILLSILRENFWIVGGRRTVRSIVNNCIKCKRYKTKSLVSDPVSLPADRVKDASVFEVIGIDLAGPLYIKRGDKTWIVLFTCAIYRAVHLELVTSLNTDAFLLAFRRFVARRGRPRIIYSDNGTNFKGAYNSLCEVDWTRVQNEAELYRISWRFNPPTAAWWGGWWERLVRTLKELLKRTLGKAVLSYEELNTILCDCEGVINSRPLTYVSEDTEDLSPLTPASFLLEKSESRVYDVDQIDAKHCRKRIRYRMKLLEELRKRFRLEYLSQLIQRQSLKGDNPNIKLGEIVLLGDDCKKRLNWPLAKVIQLIPGKDNKVRTVKLKTQNGVLTRPIQRIYPLELSNASLDSLLHVTKKVPTLKEDNSETVKPVSSTRLPHITRTGRIIKSPQRLNLHNAVEVLSHPESTQKGGVCCEHLSRENNELG